MSTTAATCYRGGGFRDTPETRAFFQDGLVPSPATPDSFCLPDGFDGKAFRATPFLATSFSRAKAEQFLRRAGAYMVPGGWANALVLWRVQLDADPARRCKHVNLVTATHVQGELEYLFAAFSVFSVVAVHWSPTPQDAATPHEITIRAAHDNSTESEDLPLAPCS